MTGDRRGQVRVRVLGPVELAGPGGAVALPAGERLLLGLLALRAGEPVTEGESVDAVQPALGYQPGAGVLGLAAKLANAGLPGALVVEPAGHLLRLPPGTLDLTRFAGLLTRARDRVAAGDRQAAVPLYTAALSNWRGPLGGQPLAGCELRPAGWAAAMAGRLVQVRIAAIEECWDARLRLAATARMAAGGPARDSATVGAGLAAAGVAGAAIAALEAVVARHPLRVRIWELLLIALFLSEGRAAAIRVGDRARAAFLAEVGIGPGERISALVEAARSGDPTLAWLADAGPGGSPTVSPGGPAGGHRPEPAPPSIAALSAEVPVPLTALLGRDELVDAVVRRLTRRRLVTLTGPGGSGKTRLALAVAGRRPPARFIDLSAVESPLRVPEAVAASLRLRDVAENSDPVMAVAGAIGAAELLLVLDNCEHVVAGCAELVGRLLGCCPGLRVLATSRIALRLPGERTVPVPPLAVPPPGPGHTLAGLTGHPASRLFLDRARACAGRPVPEEYADAVAQLCVELDGLPLAIELAAARTPSLDVREIVARLRTDLRLLRSPVPVRSPVPGGSPRHRTLVGAIDASVEQLDRDARDLFERLAVFGGGFGAEAAWAVGGPRAATGLAALVDASLVDLVHPGGWFRMLAPIRRHALSRLSAAGGELAARQGLASYCLALAERAEAGLRGAEQQLWLGRLRAEAANLRAAMSWLAEAGAAGEPYGDLRLAAALAMYHRLEGRYQEGHAWLSGALNRHPDAPGPLRARAGICAAMLAMLRCDYPAATAQAEAARRDCRASGDRRGEARVALILGSVERERARYPESSAQLAAAAAIFAECGDEWGEAQAVQLRGFTAWLSGDLDRADSRLRSGLRRCVRLGDPAAVASALMNLGAVALYRGEVDRAVSLLDAALDRYVVIGFPEGVGWAQNLRGLVELRAGRVERAGEHLTRSLAAHRQVGDRWRTASVLEALAEVARLNGAPSRGARLLGAAARIRTEIGAPVPACERPETEATGRALRSCLDAEGVGGFDAAHRYGFQAPLDVVLATDVVHSAGPAGTAPRPPI